MDPITIITTLASAATIAPLIKMLTKYLKVNLDKKITIKSGDKIIEISTKENSDLLELLDKISNEKEKKEVSGGQ